MDAACALALLAALSILLARQALRDSALDARVVAEGQSAWLRPGLMQALYAIVPPLGAACMRARVSAHVVTLTSLAFALLAAIAFATGHLGLGAWLAVLSALDDAVDGFVARHSGSASNAGELLDASADRYVEAACFAGLALYVRASAGALLLTLAALCGSFMVSYATAKAEALAVDAPRGSMRRVERLCVLIAGATFSPIAALLGARGNIPLLLALAWLAVFSNASAIRRLSYVFRELERREERS